MKKDKTFDIKLGEIILIYRKREGFTQEQLAKLIGVSAVTLGNYEKGRSSIDTETFKKLMILLNMPKDILKIINK